MAMAASCTHLDQIKEVTPSADGCEACLQMGDAWVHLRLCETCGHVGYCDSSENKHATKHFRATDPRLPNRSSGASSGSIATLTGFS